MKEITIKSQEEFDKIKEIKADEKVIIESDVKLNGKTHNIRIKLDLEKERFCLNATGLVKKYEQH